MKPHPSANLCNEFLVDHLLHMKRACQANGKDKRSLVYFAAIASIKKYPLPIICETQLRALSGIGDFITHELLKVIRTHYANQLNGRQEDVNEQSQSSVNEQTRTNVHWRVQSQADGDENSRVHEDENPSTSSVRSVVVDRTHKIRPCTFAAYYLQSLNILGKNKATRQQIKEKMKSEYNQNSMKGIVTHEANLIRNGFILEDESQKGVLSLTEKGLTAVSQIEGKTRAKQSKMKIQSSIQSFKNKIKSKMKEDVDQKSKVVMNEKVEVRREEGCSLRLIVDNREVKDKVDIDFFRLKLSTKHEIDCETAALPIGDFLWIYKHQVLDFIVERKKADDLVSSIVDGRYKEQKYRLANSGVQNIYYLFQGHLPTNSEKSEKEIKTALLKTRVKDKFKIVCTKDVNDSLRYLAFMHKQIEGVIDRGQAKGVGTLAEFTDRNGKSKQLTVQMIFAMSLKTLPGVGKNSVAELLKYFCSFRALYEELNRMQNREERVGFLKSLFKGSGIRNSLPQIIVDFYFPVK